MRYLLIALLMFLDNVLNGQIAEHFYKDVYAKIGLVIATDRMFTANTSSPNFYRWKPSNALNLGIVYNMYQKNNLNINASLIYRYWELRDEYISKIADDRFLIIESASGPFENLLLPFEAEYYFQLGENLFISPAFGFELMYNTPLDRGRSYKAVENENGLVSEISVLDSSRPGFLYLGANFGFSASIPLKLLLLNIGLKYHLQFKDYVYIGLAHTTMPENHYSLHM